MSYFKIKIRPADKLFSNYIRAKSHYRCEYCQRLCKVNDEWIYKLEASHYFSRRHESTRFDPRNVHALCFTCHKELGGYTREETGKYDLWMKELLGDEYKLLKLEANRSKKKDDKLNLIVIKELLKSIN